MFRNAPIEFLLCVLVPVLGWMFLLFWLVDCWTTTLTVTNRRVIKRKGILAKFTNEIRHADVRNIEVGQRLFQRLFGVGTIRVSSAGKGDAEIKIDGIKDPQAVAAIIRRHQG